MESVRRVFRREKTLTVEALIDLENLVIKDITLSGDFFAYPEESFEELEDSLKNTGCKKAIEILESYRNKLMLVGASIDDIELFIKEECLKD